MFACIAVKRLCFGFAIIVAGAYGQGTGEITGTITDPSSAAVSGATITVLNTATSAERVITSNETGNYDIPALTPGTAFSSPTNTIHFVQVQS